MDRLAARGLLVTGVLGICLVGVFVSGMLLTGRQLAWAYPVQGPSPAVVMWDKGFLALCCLSCILLSRTRVGVRWARPIAIALVTVATIAMVLDDVGNRDLQPRYLTLAMVVIVGLVPFSPLQTIGLAVSILAAAGAAQTVIPPWVGLEPVGTSANYYMFLILFSIALVVMSGVLYRTRYGQYVAQRRAENLALQVRGQADELRRMEAMKDRFFSNLSHEFRTPLTLLTSPLDDALEGRWGLLSEAAVKRIEVMRRNGLRLLTLINQLLDLARIDGQQFRLSVARQDIVQVVRLMVHSFSVVAESRKIALAFEAPLHRIDLLFDRDAVEKVVSNLVSNAIKFTQEGGSVRVRVDVIPGELGDEVLFAVRDNGPGIDPADLAHVFDRFFQGSGAASDYSVGTGIGLALSAEIVRRHGGTISVESEFGFGSEFRVRLPMTGDRFADDVVIATVEPDESGRSSFAPLLAREAGPDPGTRGVAQPDEEAGADSWLPAAPADAPLVLIADDDPDMRSYIVELMSVRYRTQEADDGRRALEMIRSERPDLVISDVMMPGIDGLELCRRIRAESELAGIPVVLVTALTEGDSKVRALGEGADDYICKPFNGTELMARAENLIELRRIIRSRLELTRMVEPSRVQQRSADEIFVERARKTVEEKMGNTNFSAEWLADELGLSSRQLTRKLQKLTSLSAGGFIRMVRLMRAGQLLRQRTGNVSEIAFAVGFNDAAYFSRLFKQTFGSTPSAFVADQDTDV